MTDTEVTAALNRYESVLRRFGAPVVANLRPGISAAEVRELELRYGVELPDEVRAVWEWHDGVAGVRAASGNDATRLLVPHAKFGDLSWSLEFAHEFATTIATNNPSSDYSGRAFVSLLIGNVGLMINLTPGERPHTYMNDPMSWSLADYPSMPVAERVEWWVWALENGVWQLDDKREWRVDFGRYPQGENRNVLL